MDIDIEDTSQPAQDDGAGERSRERRFARLLIGGGLLAGAALGALLTLFGAGIRQQPAPDLDGTWELAAIGEQPVAAGSPSGVVSQRVIFGGGRLRGETVYSPSAAGGGTRLPFPDESVDRVSSSPDSPNLRLLWGGTYQIDSHRQVTLHVGKAVYFASASFRAAGQTMELNQDVILTLPGAGKYRRVTAAPRRTSRESALLLARP
ncbi:MAG TPA: hypothetical protein VKT77_07280 [Chthonomonadaceae bacterium]|nr:hypothetical protein [Chthonomonadaceae bacterium]